MSGHEHAAQHRARRPRHTGRWLAGVLVLVALSYGGMALHEAQQREDQRIRDAQHLTGGEPSRGPALRRMDGCAQCHTVPGVAGANGLVGPPLSGIANRMYVAGVVTNTPANLVQWIQNPKAIDPKTAMPVVGVSERHARHIAAYLYTLR
jgi:cytochrome c